MSRIGNPVLDRTLMVLKQASKSSGASLWLDASRYLSKSRSRKPTVNIGKLDRLAEKDSVILVPGKILGDGVLSHPVVVGAYSYTATARRKIVEAGGEALTIPNFLKRFPSGAGVTLIGG
jgi:large subunit ribosomal protein L18e